MKTGFGCAFAFIFLSACLFTNVKAASTPLSLNMAINRSIYMLPYSSPASVLVDGNLTLNGAPVSDGLVALTVIQGENFSRGYIRPILFRTLSTGMIPVQDWPIANVSVTPLKYNGSYIPSFTFHRPSSRSDLGPFFNITFRNVAVTTSLYLTLTIVDHAQEPITTRTLSFQPQSIPVNSTVTYITDPIYLGDWVALGNATAYVCFFDEFPPYIYTPYCPESSTGFQIILNSGNSLSTQTSDVTPKNDNFAVSNGTFNLLFKFNYHMTEGSVTSPWGNYTIRVSCHYEGNLAVDTRTFWVRIPGDLNGDGVVDISDGSLIGRYWLQATPPLGNADPAADANKDGFVDISDAAIMGAYWQRHEQYYV